MQRLNAMYSSNMYVRAENSRHLKDEVNLTIIACDRDRYILIRAPVHKEAACQRNQTPAVNNDNKSDRHAHELIPGRPSAERRGASER